ncbi:DUF1587 domain-containing protein [Urbifossiella limnaea]|uniref:DUF1587 domain-containing protein n=1 Tax=Urbifossiella limnaea TaxID=2528023 RepID=A0A517XQK3_9BACT|nr:DUF1587 domain-containing protein [Urbifossiella limnaea]QDU19780.1 hypothetical protein ETAA1_17170 [Urbifossiella limnaea]
MPPKDKPQPTAAEKERLLAWIVAQQKAAGPGGTRRLNKREAGAAFRDVTGLPVDFGHGLPGDGTVAGFDTGADGLQDAADSVATWVRVTKRVVDGVRFTEPSPGVVFAADLRGQKDARKVFDPWKVRDGAAKELGRLLPQLGGLLLEPRSPGDREVVRFTVPPPPERQGVVRVRLTVSVKKPVPDLPHPRLWVEVGGRPVDYRELAGPADAPVTIEYLVHTGDLAIQKGVNVSLSNKVERPYAVPGFENEDRSRPEDKLPPGGWGLFRPAFDRRTLQPEQWPAPLVILHEVEIESNHIAPWPPAEWKADVARSPTRRRARRSSWRSGPTVPGAGRAARPSASRS